MGKKAQQTFTGGQPAATSYFVGKYFKVIRAQGGFKVGEKFKCSHIGYGNPIYVYKEGRGTYITPQNLELIPQTIEELEIDIKEKKELLLKIDNEIIELEDKIKFMQENQIKEFDETQFKAYHTLSLLENNKLSKLEKSRLIAKLINND